MGSSAKAMRMLEGEKRGALSFEYERWRKKMDY